MHAWQDALVAWMGVENLEARQAAPGWIDPRVLAFRRENSARTQRAEEIRAIRDERAAGSAGTPC